MPCARIGARKTLIITAHQGRFIIILQDPSRKPAALAFGGVATIWQRQTGQVANGQVAKWASGCFCPRGSSLMSLKTGQSKCGASTYNSWHNLSLVIIGGSGRVTSTHHMIDKRLAADKFRKPRKKPRQTTSKAQPWMKTQRAAMTMTTTMARYAKTAAEKMRVAASLKT